MRSSRKGRCGVAEWGVFASIDELPGLRIVRPARRGILRRGSTSGDPCRGALAAVDGALLATAISSSNRSWLAEAFGYSRYQNPAKTGTRVLT